MRLPLAALVAAGALACGGAPPAPPPPQSPARTLADFLAAVQANDLARMGHLWGSERGHASTWMKQDELKQRLTVIQKYLDHVGYRVLEGPTPVPGNERLQRFRVELQRANACTVAFPVDLVRTGGGGWLVNAIDLASLPNPARACRP